MGVTAIFVSEAESAVQALPAISRRQFFQALAAEATISEAEALAALRTGTVPAVLGAILDGLDPDMRFAAEMHLSGSGVFERSHPLVALIGAAQGRDAGEIDAFWRGAAAL